MTKEEAIKELQEAHDIMRSYDIDSSESRLMTALNIAIEALEKEPILDKIRAEIIEMRSKQNVGALECLDIIDKYREPKFNVGTVGIISRGGRTLADLVAEGLKNEV